MPVVGVAKFERFFRRAAELDVDRDDLKRYSDFANRKLYDLLLIGQATAAANGRDVVAPHDLPITKGLQENIHAFRRMDEELELAPILTQLSAYPPLDRALSDETEARMPLILGGLSLALAQVLKIIEPDLKNPGSEHWERAFRTFDLVL
jgi:hypothetical protein